MLDKTRPFYLVKGDPRIGFEQDGMLFDGAGRLLITETAEHVPVSVEPIKSRSEKMKEAWARRKASEERNPAIGGE